MRDGSSTLRGLRIALLEARAEGELASLVRRHGGQPYCVPAVREEPTDHARAVTTVLDALAGKEAPVFVLSTGVGTEALVRTADALGRGDELLSVLRRATLVCRSPKPVHALKQLSLTATVRAKEPHTQADLLLALGEVPLEGRPAVVVHHGERSPEVVDAIRRRGARVHELLLYEWRLPADTGPLARLVDEVIERRVGAVAFTSQIQARHLTEIAKRSKRLKPLLEALRTHTLVAAVGPTCARVLADLGAPAHVVPEHPKMGAMVASLARHVSSVSMTG